MKSAVVLLSHVGVSGVRITSLLPVRNRPYDSPTQLELKPKNPRRRVHVCAFKRFRGGCGEVLSLVIFHRGTD